MTSIIELVPKPLAAVAVVHLGISFGFASVFADRKAEWVHIPACQAQFASAEADGEFSALSEAERKRRVVATILKGFPQLREIPMVRDLQPLLAPPARRRQAGNFASRCACLVDAAIAKTRWDHTIWVSTLRTYTPRGVSQFPGVMAQMERTGACGSARSQS